MPTSSMAKLLPGVHAAVSGEIAIAEVERIGKNTRLELANGRSATLHVGDLIAVVFGNRYATMQFEGYAGADGDHCDLLSMGGLCGVLASKHATVADSTKLRLLGTVADSEGTPLRLADFSLDALPMHHSPKVAVVCGTSMDAGKTYTAISLIRGLRREVNGVAGIKLTGTAAGRDTWGMLDAGACAALDFVDGGFPSTYLARVDELMTLYRVLVSNAAARGASWIVLEIADGLLQRETSALLQLGAFVRSVDAWVFAAGDPLAASAGVRILRGWGIEPVAVSGRVTMSQLAIREAEAATGLPCLTAAAVQDGACNPWLLPKVPRVAETVAAAALVSS
ncbi:MAG: hypothetical protein QM756_06450 [Polyangiaceae bacterium]